MNKISNTDAETFRKFCNEFIKLNGKGREMDNCQTVSSNQEKTIEKANPFSRVDVSVDDPVASRELNKMYTDSDCKEECVTEACNPKACEPEPLIHYGGLSQQSDANEINVNELTAQVKFGDEIKILLIAGVDLRIMCHVLGLQSVNDIKSANYTNVPLISLLLMETLIDYMKGEGYEFAGEIMFDCHGNPIPVTKHTWMINKKCFSFTRTGYMYFEKTSGNSNENVVVFVNSSLEEHQAGLTCYSENESKSKTILSGLDDYAKKHNGLRGAKLRNINVMTASFEETEGFENITWDNYYYEENVKNVIDLQIFGFLNNIEKHNERNIFKRGIMVHGPPGTGKTSLGKIICHYAKDITVIWITPDLISDNSYGQQSIKLLYMLSDYLSPGVVILEDMDLFSSDRESGMVNQLSLGTLMNILDGIYSIKNMVTLATTNRMDAIEQALRNRPGRFDRMVEIPALNDELRTKMFKDKMIEFTFDDDSIFDNLVDNTKEWTGAEIQEIINSFHMYFIQHDEEENLLIDQELLEHILGTMAKYSLQEGRYQKKLGFS